MGSYTTRKYNLFKPALLEPAGTWGDKVSQNFDEIDQKALSRNGDSMMGDLDMGSNSLKQGPFRQSYNSTLNRWELYINIAGTDVRFAVFELSGGKVNFRINGQFLEGESL